MIHLSTSLIFHFCPKGALPPLGTSRLQLQNVFDAMVHLTSRSRAVRDPCNVMISYNVIMPHRRAKKLPKKSADFFLEELETHPTCWFKQFDGSAFCSLTHDGRRRPQMVVPDLWWLVARGTANASEFKVAFRCSYDTIASYHQSSGEGGFHFGDFVSPSLYKGRCCASRRRCQQLDHACVGFMLFATTTMTHFTVSPILRLFLDNVEPREYARELLETNLAMGRCVSKPRRQSTSGKPHVRRVPVQTLLGNVLHGHR